MAFLDDILNRVKQTGSNILNTGGKVINTILDQKFRTPFAGTPLPAQAQEAPLPTPSPSPAGDPFKVLNKTFSIQGATPIPQATAAPTTAAIQQRARAQATTGGLGRNLDLGKYSISPQVHSAIQGAANRFGLPPSLLYDIAASEGGFRTDAANETPEGREVGVPRGLFQFTPGTWENDLRSYASSPNSSLTGWMVNGQVPDRNDPVANALAAAYLIKMGQLGRWTASEPNWGRYYSDEELAPYFSQTPGYKGRGR